MNKLRTAIHSRLGRLLISSLLLINCIAVGLAQYYLAENHDLIEHEAGLAADGLMNTLDLSLSNSVEKVDLALRLVVQELEWQLRTTGQLDEHKIKGLITRCENQLMAQTRIRISDARGVVTLGNDVDAKAQISWADRISFREQQEKPDAGLSVSEPLLGRVSKMQVIAFVRRYQNQDGKFAGIVSIAVPLAYFSDVLERAHFSANSQIVLSDTAGHLIASNTHDAHSEVASVIGRQEQLLKRERTVVIAPFRLSLAIPQSDVLQVWYAERRHVLGGLAFFFLITAACVALLMRSILALEKEKKHSQALFRHAGDGIHILNLKAEVQESSDAFCQMLGYPSQQITGMHASEWSERYTREYLLQLVDDYQKNPAARVYEDRYRTHSGNMLDVEVSTSLFELDGQTLIFNAVRDVSARKKAEQALRDSEQRYRQFFNLNIAVKLVVDPTDGAIVDVNQAAEQFYGYTRAQLLGMNISAINCLSRTEIQREMALAASEQRLYFNFRHKLANGESRDVEVYSGPISVNGKVLLYSIVHDISKRRIVEEQLRLASSIFSNSYEGMMITDAQNCVVDINPAFTRITGYAKEEILGKTPGLLNSGRQTPEFYIVMWRALQQQGFWQGEIWNRKKNGEIYAEMLSISVVRDDAGELKHYVALFSDISAIKKHEEELDRIANYDALTGIPNRRLFSDRLQQAIARTARATTVLAVCYLDLDGFKPVNDTYGHSAGDFLLVEIARRLKKQLRAHDTLARLGGDEFVLLLADLHNIEEAKLILERVSRAVAAPVTIGSNEVTVTASIGVSLCPPEEADADILLRHADQAMYRAKDSGKNHFEFSSRSQPSHFPVKITSNSTTG